MEAIKVLSYEDYKGGGGSSSVNNIINNVCMMKSLHALGIPFRISTDWEEKIGVAVGSWSEPAVALLNIKDGEEMFIAYDRWGFVVDGMGAPELEDGDFIDQWGIDDTLNQLKKWYDEGYIGKDESGIYK